MTDYIRAQSIVGYSKKRAKYDYYTTPPYATEALIAVEAFPGVIWEPACGNGAISKVLLANNLSVISSDLINRGYGEWGVDFLTADRRVDHVITNPPYSLGQEFVEHSLLCATHKVAMLLKVNFLEGVRRRKMFESTPLKKVWVFSKRVTQLKDDQLLENGGMMCFAWFVWDHQYLGEPMVGWL
jgi:hypothetical protein